MKYLIKFNEYADFDISPTDPIDLKLAKGQLDLLKKNIDEYKQKKSSIENVFNKYKTLEEINTEIEKITSKSKNQFISELVHLLTLEKNIEISQNSRVQDKLKIEDFQQELSFAKDDTTKANINSKINDLKNRIQENNKKIVDIQKELLESEKKHKDGILKIEKDTKDNIQNISQKK